MRMGDLFFSSRRGEHRVEWSLGVGMLLLSFILSCSQRSSPSKLRMVQGQKPTAESPASWSAVALVDRKGQSFCSGALIAPQLIVTAAHCVFDKAPGDMWVAFGSSPEGGDAAVKLKVTARETFKKGQKYESNFDIAWVRFEGTAPANYRPLEIWHGSTELKAGTELTIAGYGQTASLCEGAAANCQGGQLLEVKTQLREFVDQTRLYDLIVIDAPEDGKAGPCFGDSGGPAYLERGGRWYLVGDFMGWDRILVPEDQGSICDYGTGIYNFVGSYAAWIEASSGIPLSFDATVNPRPAPEALPTLEAEPQDFQGWCRYSNHEDPAWYTVQRLIRLASDYRLSIENAQGAREVFEDCAVAETWLRAMLEAKPHLVIAGYDPQNFIDRAFIEDVRPLASLAPMGLRGLTLSEHKIADLSPLMRLSSLQQLEIIDNVPAGLSLVPNLRIQQLEGLKSLKVHNSQGSIDFRGLGQLEALEELDLASLPPFFAPGEALVLENPALESLSLDEVKTPITLRSTERLTQLRIRKTPLTLPTSLGALESLEIYENPEPLTLPSQLPQLRQLTLYASGLKGRLSFERWKNLERVSVVAHPQLTEVEGLQNLPELTAVEILDNKLQAMGPLRALPRLRELSLARNGLQQVPAFTTLPELRRLDLDGNSLKKLSALAGLEKLDWLNLNNNPLENLEGVSGLQNLRRLTARNQRSKGLTSLEGLRELPKLEDLNLGRNSLKELSPLQNLTELRVLVLSDNLIEDVSPLRALKELEYLELVNNPLKTRECPSPQPDVCRFEWVVISGFGDFFPPNAPVL